MGRFMSPDWSAKEEPVPYATMNDPQSLNLYAYVRNNPLRGVDPDGHEYLITAPTEEDNSNSETESSQSVADQQQAQQEDQQQTDQQQTASVVFGETSGLTSEVDKNGKPVTTPGADPNLDTARENVADVSKRNSGVYSHTPTAEELKNPQVKAAWEASQAAANDSKGSLPGKYFFIRQEGVGKQRPSQRAGFGQGTPIKSYGPFKNAGGGDVPSGSRTYIDIYYK